MKPEYGARKWTFSQGELADSVTEASSVVGRVSKRRPKPTGLSSVIPTDYFRINLGPFNLLLRTKHLVFIFITRTLRNKRPTNQIITSTVSYLPI